METNGVSVHWVCVYRPWCRTQGPALGKVVTAESLCEVRCKCHIWTFWRCVRGRIYSRAKTTHCSLQIEMKSGSKLLPLMALLPEWIRVEPWPPTPARPLGLGMSEQQRACALTGLKLRVLQQAAALSSHCPLYLQNSCFAVTAFLCEGKKV